MKHNILKFLKLNIAAIAVFSMTSCLDNGGNGRNKFADDAQKFARGAIDYEADLTRDEIRDALRPAKNKADRDEKEVADKNKVQEDLEFNPIVIAPSSPEIKSNKRVSLTVSENIDIRDVLLELARLAELELALDPYIKGGIVLNVNNRPVNEVIELVSDLADLRYSVENGVLKVMRDAPYLVNYSVDYLNLTRSGSGSMDTQTKVLSVSVGGSSGGSGGGSGGGSSGGGGGGGGNSNFNSGSTNQITTEYSGDLWQSVESNLVSILNAKTSRLKTGQNTLEAPASTSQNQQPAATTTDGANIDPSLQQDFNQEVIVGNQQGSSAAGATGGQGGASQQSNQTLTSYYTLNKQAGIISVMATYKKHKFVKEYLDKVKKSISAQVLIEAKVVEVELNQNYARGIDWSAIKVGNMNLDTNFQIASTSATSDFTAGVFTSSGLSAPSLSWTKPHKTTPEVLMQFFDKFGVTRVLQNPRITVVNNQQAILSFARNEVYFTVSSSLQSATTSGTTTNPAILTATSSLQTVPIGVIIALQPSIDIDKQEVTMHIRPTLSSLTGVSKDDPAVAITKLNALASISSPSKEQIELINNIKSQIPQVQVRELDTILKARSGDVMVIGGLIEHSDKNGEAGVPYLSEIPILGSLAKQSENQSVVKETIIMLQATILNNESYYHPQDKKIYETFTQDPRPAIFN